MMQVVKGENPIIRFLEMVTSVSLTGKKTIMTVNRLPNFLLVKLLRIGNFLIQ